MEPFLGQIMMVGFNFAPRGWATCNGQIMSIAQNTALFSLLGTTYGGNGQTTFALPNLQSRVPIHAGQGPGLNPYTLGEVGGAEFPTLSLNQMPIHNHTVVLPASSAEGTTRSPVNAAPAAGGSYAGAGNANALTGATANTGGSQPFNNIQPFLCVNFIIAIEGIFPSRN